MVGAIVGFRMRVKRIDAKFKLSQNRTPDDRARVAAALDGGGLCRRRRHGGVDARRTSRAPMARADRAEGTLAAPAGRVRFDKWLWAARFYKTRSLAAQAIDAGQARLAGAAREAGARGARRRLLCRCAAAGSSSKSSSPRYPTGADRRPMPRRCIAKPTASVAAREAHELARRQAMAAQPRFAGRPDQARPAPARGFSQRALSRSQQSLNAERSSSRSGFW